MCACRIPRQQTVVYGSSYCPKCEHPLGIWDLIPVLSFILLKGNCRYCHAPISRRYPLVEILTGTVFAVAYLRLGAYLLLIKYLVLFSVLIVISLIDLDWQIIPNELVILILGWGLLWQFIRPELSWGQLLMGGLTGGGILLLIAIISRGGMGGGDIKLMFAAGLILGGPGTLLALFLAFVTGALGGGLLLASGLKGRKEPISFGPFLAFGIVTASLWGEQLIRFYLNLSSIK